MKHRIRIFLIVITAVIFAASFWASSSAQRRDNFSHATAAHKKLNCNSCHKIPTGNWVSARGYPDVADYPGHVACFGCHKADFFAGNKPAICAGCHVNPGPRGAARFPFPVRSRSHEFSTIFPHDAHQNIIARNYGPRDIAVAHFVNANFSRDDPVPQFNNCAICHQTYSKEPKSIARKLIRTLQPLADAAANNFVAKAEFFKNNPDSHASCFTCHYQNQKPIRTDCAGCHRLTAAHAESSVVPRYSLKFNHQDKDHANKDCTTCHIRITQTADLKQMKDADVPILTCSTSSCHSKDINVEIGKRDESIEAKQPVFQCIYCHTPEIGRYPVPDSHRVR